jgi:Protein of unknown function (DUF3455)
MDLHGTSISRAASAPLFALAIAGMGAALSACTTPAAKPSDVPATLRPPAGEKLAFSVAASGVQIYACTAAEGEAAPKWLFVAPEAVLHDAAGTGAEVGSHGAGPHWLWSDGSKVTGKVEARADAPAAGNIPWLLLKTTPGGLSGRLAPVTYIQRVHTAGGVAPASGCASKDDTGRQVRVPYTSDYVFFVHAG